MALFEFNADQGETPQTLEAKRAVVMALARAGTTGVAHNLGEGIGKVGNALAYAMANSRYEDAEAAAQKSYADSLNSILGGGATTPSAVPSAVPPQPPSIPAAAVSGDSLRDTPAPLSGGLMPAQTTDAALPRGLRNNNPLNIEAGQFTSSQPGFTGSDGRFAQFASMDQGLGAADNLLQSYAGKGINTVNGIVSRWAPLSDGNPTGQYAATVAKAIGVDPNAPLDMTNPATRQGIIGAMAQFENGRPLPQIASNDSSFVPSTNGGMNPQLAAMLSPNMTVGDKAFAPLAFNGQPQSNNPLANPQSFAPQSNPQSSAQPNITTVPTRPVTLPVEGQNNGRAAVVQALQNQPQQTAIPASNIPPQVADTIRKLSMNPLPQAQQMAAQLMQQYMKPHQYGFQTLPDGTVMRTDPLTGTIAPVYQSQTPYQLMQQPDGTVMAVNPRNPKDNYVAFKGAAKPISVAPGATLVVPGQTSAPQTTPSDQTSPAAASPGVTGFRPVYQNTTGLFDKKTLTAMADQYLTGDKSVLQNLGRTTIGGMNMSALRERIVSRAQEMGISPTEIASRIGQFDSYTSAQKATGTRGGNVTMAATEASNLGALVNETSAAVPRSNYPVWNKVTNAYAENTGDPKIVQFTGALNSYINAYARAINPSGSTTVSDKEHAREILDTAMSHGQIEAGIAQLQKELVQAKAAPASASETIKNEFMTRANPKNSEAVGQARDAIARGADRNAVIQRLQGMGVDPSGL